MAPATPLRSGAATAAAPARSRLGPLRLGRPVALVPARREPAPLDGTELRFFTDFLASFGERPDHDRYARGGGSGFIDLAGALLDGLPHPPPPLDTVVLAYHLPDRDVVEVAGCYLADRLPGTPEVLSLAGQGVGAPFTALRLLDRMRAAGHAATGAVLVLDQTTVPYADPDVRTGPGSDAAVLLHDDGGPAMELLAVDEQQADPRAALRSLTRRHPDTRIVAGRMLAERLDPRESAEVVRGPANALCTSAWSPLADAWNTERPTLVADFDPHAGRLFTALLAPAAAR
jgi:hypothetical protein